MLLVTLATLHLSMAYQDLITQRVTSMPSEYCFWSSWQEGNLLIGMHYSCPFSYLKIQLSCFLIRKLFLCLWHSSKPREEQSLVKWASLRLHDYESLEEMIDPGIRKTCSSKALSNFADIISLCIQVVFNSITQLNICIAKFELFD